MIRFALYALMWINYRWYRAGIVATAVVLAVIVTGGLSH